MEFEPYYFTTNRRGLIRLGWGALLLMTACQGGFRHEQRYDDGKISRIYLPGGENQPQTGEYSLSIPRNKLVGLFVESPFRQPSFRMEVSLDARITPRLHIVAKLGRADEPVTRHGFDVNLYSINSSLDHTLTASWAEWKFHTITWDGTRLRISDPTPTPSTYT